MQVGATTGTTIQLRQPERRGALANDPSDEPEFGRPIDALLPMPVRVTISTVVDTIRHGIDLIIPDPKAPDGSTIVTALDRAHEASRALKVAHGVWGRNDRFYANESQGRLWTAEAWPIGQVLHGRAILAMEGRSYHNVDTMFRDLERYRVDDGFVGGIGSGDRYYDDNAWIGLAAMQAYNGTHDARYLRHAERTFRMVASGAHSDGGVDWFEQNRTSRNTCSTAPAGELAMQIYMATGDQQYLSFAKLQSDFLERKLRTSSGMYADHLDDSGYVDPAIYSYNQGTPIGLNTLLYRVTGQREYLDRARTTADAALHYFSKEDRLWRQAPAFNAIFFRNLLALDAVAPNPAYLGAFDDYLERLWKDARNPETGMFTEGNIGTYEEGHPASVLDQGAIAQMYAVRALPNDRWSMLT